MRSELGRGRSYERPTAAAACIFLRRRRRSVRPSVHPGYSSSAVARACATLLFSRLCALSVDRSTLSLSLPLFHLRLFVFGDFNERSASCVRSSSSESESDPQTATTNPISTVTRPSSVLRSTFSADDIEFLADSSSPAFTDGGLNTAIKVRHSRCNDFAIAMARK